MSTNLSTSIAAMKLNEHKGKEILITLKTTIEELEYLIKYEIVEKSIWVTLRNGYFNPDIYEYLMLNKFTFNITTNESIARKLIEKDIELPPFPNFVVGAGGIVYNKIKDEILMIKQTYGPKTFKFPGGLANQGEKPLDAAIREVQEEVGLKTVCNNTRPIIVFPSVKKDNLVGSHVDL